MGVPKNFLVKWNRLLNEASLETKYLLKGDELNIYVISLKRLSQRAHETSLSLQAQGIPWTVHEAFDGLGEIDAELVSKYAGAKKRTAHELNFPSRTGYSRASKGQICSFRVDTQQA